MSFFDFGTETNTGSFESYTEIQPIPKNTVVKAIAEQAKWSQYNDDPEFIEITWVVQGGDYNNRRIFQKCRTQDSDPVKAKKAMQMLGAINHNAKGNLDKISHKPTDSELAAAICFKPMMLKVGVWSIDKDEFGNPIPADQRKSGNWVAAVSPVTSQTVQMANATQQQPTDLDNLPF